MDLFGKRIHPRWENIMAAMAVGSGVAAVPLLVGYPVTVALGWEVSFTTAGSIAPESGVANLLWVWVVGIDTLFAGFVVWLILPGLVGLFFEIEPVDAKEDG